MNSINLAKTLFFIGIGLIAIGGIIYLGSKIGIPLGKMVGDIHVKKEKYSIYFPIVTSIVISVFLTIIFNLIAYFVKK